MTIEKLKRFNKYENWKEMYDKIYQEYQGHIPKFCDNLDDMDDKELEFWSKILDCINDEEIQRMLYMMLVEASACYWLIDCMDIEELKEIIDAYFDERLFVSPFKPGDYISKNGSNPEKVVSVTFDDATCWPSINTERNVVVTDVKTINNDIKPSDCKKYKVVNEPQKYTLYIDGEGIDEYW